MVVRASGGISLLNVVVKMYGKVLMTRVRKEVICDE